LLQFAEGIAKSRYEESPAPPYPQDVFGITRALVRWHRTVARLVDRGDDVEM
jgi:hypothetical protein